MNLTKALLNIIVLLLFFSNYSFADNNLDKKLRDLKLRAELQEKMLLQSQKEIATLKVQLSDLDLKIDTSQSREQDLRSELKQIDASVAEMNGQIIVNKGKISILNESFRSRVRAIYKMQKGSTVFDYFANSQSMIEVLKKRRFLKEIAKSDKELLNAVNDAVLALEDGLRRLASLRTRRQETLDELTLLLAGMQHNKNFQVELIDRKEKRRQTIKLALNDLKNSANELEKSLSGLIEKHTPQIQNFNLKTGSLIFPVNATIQHGFGKRKHQEFSDFVFSKGIEFKTEQDLNVKAAASGKVLLARELPGYGMVLILDHGARVYSLYARIKNLIANVGDEIASGQKLAEAQKEQNFYFELRKMGKAIDPMPFFNK